MTITEEQASRLCAAARAYAGTPWLGQGRDKRGIDCTGLIEMAFVDAGFPVERKKPEYRNVDSKLLMATLLRYCARLPDKVQPLPGDIVVFGRSVDTHLALLLDGKPLNAIHSPIGGRVIEARFDPKRGPIRGIYRWQQSFSSPP